MNRQRFEFLLTDAISRRRLLGVALAVPTAAISRRNTPTRAAGTHPVSIASSRAQAGGPLFALGVASGDPRADSIVLWTRLAPDPLNGGGIDPIPIDVRWELADDSGFTKIVQSGVETAIPELAHSVHVDVTGLRPGRDYFYRFFAGDEVSPTGRTRTAPALDARVEQMRFAFASCAHYEHGFFSAYRQIAADDLDLVLHLGDYIYEYAANGEYGNGDRGPVRNVTGGETFSLADYRNRHALYKTDSDLQAVHASAPWVVTWDDHEVENDYAGDRSENGDPVESFLQRRAAAYQAYYEHMPVQPGSMPAGAGMPLYRRLPFGTLIEFNLLDGRQYRSDQCGTVGPLCADASDPAATMLGAEQELWLEDGFTSTNARWNVLAQQTMMAKLDVDVSPGAEQFNMDQWDGYPAARERLLRGLVDAGVSNPVVLAGDIHSAWANDLKLDFDAARAPVVATEFVGSSITSFNPFADRLGLLRVTNPHIRFYDGRHGYVRCTVTPERWTAEYRAMEDVTTETAELTTIVTFVVEDGEPGVQEG